MAAFSRYLALSPDDRHGALPHLALLGATPAPDTLPSAYVTALFDECAPRFERSLLIDLGCGTGLVGERLRARSRWIQGVDLSPAMVAKAGSKAVYDAQLVGELVGHMAGGGRCFGLITAADVLIYLGDLAPFFAAAAGRLAEAGLLAVPAEAAVAPLCTRRRLSRPRRRRCRPDAPAPRAQHAAPRRRRRRRRLHRA